MENLTSAVPRPSGAKLISVLLCVSLCITVLCGNLARAEAAELENHGNIGVSVAAMYLAAVGIPLVILAGGSLANNAAIASAAASYVAATGAASSGSALLASIGAGVTVSPAGLVILSVAAAAALGAFAAWCWQNYLDSGSAESAPILNNKYLALANGGQLVMGIATYSTTAAFASSVDITGATPIYLNDVINFSSGLRLEAAPYSAGSGAEGDYQLATYLDGQSTPYQSARYFTASNTEPLYIVYNPSLANPGQYSPVLLTQEAASPYRWVKKINIGLSLTEAQEVANSQAVDIAGTYQPPPIPTEDERLQLSAPGIVVPGTKAEDLPAIIDNAIDEDKPLVVTPELAPAIDDTWNPALPGAGAVTQPNDPGTDVPYLPTDIPIPWHYVELAIDYSAAFISLAMITFSNFVPTSMQAVVWASVVLAILFGLIKKALG